MACELSRARVAHRKQRSTPCHVLHDTLLCPSTKTCRQGQRQLPPICARQYSTADRTPRRPDPARLLARVASSNRVLGHPTANFDEIVPETDPLSQGWSCLFWAVFVAAMTGASLKLTKVLTVILVFRHLAGVASGHWIIHGRDVDYPSRRGLRLHRGGSRALPGDGRPPEPDLRADCTARG